MGSAAPAWSCSKKGSIDDTAAIVSAVSSANGAILYFPPGTYLSDPVDLSAITSGITIVGAGIGTTTIKSNATSDATAVFHTNDTAVDNIRIY
ncbi:MAG: hypothetical protein IID51_07615, partial [Proteobacteria bacterium]|nr:hypothetical protein [Pseudomonadota bacterium]